MSAATSAPERLGRPTVLALVATAIEKGGAMLTVLAIARIVGTEEFGRWAALMSVLALCQVAAEFGQEPVLVRLLAQGGGSALSRFTRAAVGVRLLLATLAGAVLFAIGEAVLPEVDPVVRLLAALGLVAGSGTSFHALFRTLRQLDAFCAVALAHLLVFALALAAVYAGDLGLPGVVGGWAMARLAASLTASALAARTVRPLPRWDRSATAALLRSGWPLAMNGFLLTVTLRVGQLIVLHIEGPAAVGYLAAGSRLAEAFTVIPEAVMLVLLPVLAAYGGDQWDRQRAMSVRAVRYLGLVALAVVVAVWVGAPALLALLFGPEYVAAAPALRVLAWYPLVAASGTVFSNLLIARGRERVLLALNAYTSAATIVLSLMLVPYAGFTGAAVATVVATVSAQALLLLLPVTRHDVAACLRPLAGPVVLATVVALAARFVPVPPLLAAAGAVAVFALIAVAVGAISAEDWRTLRGPVPP